RLLSGLGFFLMTGLRISRLAIVVLLRMTHPAGCEQVMVVLEGRLVAEAGATRGPWVVRLAGVSSAGEPTLVATESAASPTGEAATAGESAAAPTLGAGDLRGGVTHGRAHLVDLEFDDGALLALARLEGALHQASLCDHAHTLGHGLGDVLRRVATDGATQEEGVAVGPLVLLPVETARGRCDREVGNGRPRGGEPQFRISREVSDHGDNGLACHDAP